MAPSDYDSRLRPTRTRILLTIRHQDLQFWGSSLLAHALFRSASCSFRFPSHCSSLCALTGKGFGQTSFILTSRRFNFFIHVQGPENSTHSRRSSTNGLNIFYSAAETPDTKKSFSIWRCRVAVDDRLASVSYLRACGAQLLNPQNSQVRKIFEDCTAPELEDRPHAGVPWRDKLGA